MLVLVTWALFSTVILAHVRAQEQNMDPCCVRHFLCKNNSTLNAHGQNVIDYRNQKTICPDLFLCCNLPDRYDEKIENSILKENRPCGQRNKKGVQYRRGGLNEMTTTLLGEFPWLMALLSREDDDDRLSYKCGGSLIHPQVVMTAAHCIKKLGSVSKVIVRAGEQDPNNDEELVPYQDRAVESILLHGGFDKDSLYNDVALVFLASPFNMSYENVGTACLPRQDEVIVNNDCFVTGWGKNIYRNNTSFESSPKKIPLPIVNHEECQRILRDTRLGDVFVLDQSFLCAGGKVGVDSCVGDGGSPLVCKIEGSNLRYYQAGIVAWGIECGLEVPAAYANVAKFINWIRDEMEKRGFELSDTY